ncbi:MAG: hypothetical protein AAF206_11525 [Bacteroidota bacterium]
MNDAADIRRLFRPLYRGFGFLVLCMIYGLYSGREKADSMLPVYESRATIKLNDEHSALTKFLEEVESFSTIGGHTVELTVIRSETFLRQAFEMMDVEVSYFRKRFESWRDLYQRELFRV